MFAGTFLLEDHTLSFCAVAANTATKFKLTVSDSATGKAGSIDVNFAELGAILALAFGGDEIAGSAELYAVAEPAVAHLPLTLRPIP